MKSIAIIALTLFVLTSCGRENGSVDIEGYLMNQCGSADPLGGVNVTFGINGTDLITTKTDAFGYFKLTGSYDYKNSTGKPIEKSVAIVSNGQNGGGFGTIMLADKVPDKVNLDTVYRYNSTNVNIHIVGGSNTTINDTLYVALPKPGSVWGWDTVVLAGPLHDTALLELPVLVPPHIGYPEYYAGGFSFALNPEGRFNYRSYTNMNLPFVKGQPNHACGRVYDVTLDLSK